MTDNTGQQMTTNDNNGIKEVAELFARNNIDIINASEILKILSRSKEYLTPHEDLPEIIKKAFDPKNNGKRDLTAEIKDLFMTTFDNITTTFVYQVTTLTTREDKKKACVILGRLVKDGFIERVKGTNGVYRRVNNECEEIDFMNARADALPVRWPLETLVAMIEVYSKNIVVVAGEQNSGKTAFLLDFTRQNMDRHKINYFSSEMSDAELKKRLLQFGEPLESWKKCRFIDRSIDFADVIVPNEINIIDFMEIHDNFYQIGGMIRAVYDKLDEGICLIALQKNKNTDFGLGGARGLEKPRIYLSLSSEFPGGRCKVVKAKNWATDTNPNGYSCKYKLVAGCRFIEDGNWERGN